LKLKIESSYLWTTLTGAADADPPAIVDMEVIGVFTAVLTVAARCACCK
jgi:hypothetical protein